MSETPNLVPQRPSSVIYELVKNRLLVTDEFKGLDPKEVNKRMHKVNTAYRISKQAHYDQERDNWEDYFKNHIVPVLEIYLNELRWTSLTWVLSAILHDAVEDSEEVVDLHVIKKLISPEVAESVEYLTKPHYSSYLSWPMKAHYDKLNDKEKKDFLKPHKHLIGIVLVKEYFEKMQKWANNDTLRVKVADRIHNLRTLPDDVVRIQKYIKETEQYIIPIIRDRDMQREIKLIERELVKLKIRLQNLSNQNLLKDILEEQPK